MARTNDGDKLRTSRAGRAVKLGRVFAEQALRQAGASLSSVGRDEEKAREVNERRQGEALKALVTGLGTMRGAAMKIGQVLSVIDGGVVPESQRDDFQRALAQLRDNAPKMSFEKMKSEIEAELGDTLKNVFAEFDSKPIGAASIGQVYRARLRDGRDVVVKVQYPGIEKAIRADLKNMTLLMRAVKMITPNLDAQAVADEVRERVEEELDYELEAQNQRAAARLYRGHPFIVVPDVIGELSGRTVLVTDYFDGSNFEELKEADQATRDRAAEIVFRFFLSGLWRHREFSGDPHPGNFLFAADGRVAFLDFGLYKYAKHAEIERQLDVLRALTLGDNAQLYAKLVVAGYLPIPMQSLPNKHEPTPTWSAGWLTTDQTLQLTPAFANELMAPLVNFTTKESAVARKSGMPPDQLVAMRTLVMVLAALGQLSATNNWHRIAREWMFGDPPATPLGRQEAESDWGRMHATPTAAG